MTCRHCGLPSPEGQLFCCPGCEAVYGFIHSSGLQDYYRFRETAPGVAVDARRTSQAYLDEQLARSLLFEGSYHFVLDGLHCAACAWLIERALSPLGQVTVNYASRRLYVKPKECVHLATLIDEVERLGYRAVPYDPNRSERPRRQSDRWLLLRFGVAASVAGNVMLAALALYSGADLDAEYRPLFHWLSLVLALPVVTFSAWPFWRGAYNALRLRQLTTDVAIALGLGVTFLASVQACLTGQQHVYFDTVTTFVFVLLLGRVLEGAARTEAGATLEHLLSLQVSSARRWNGEVFEEVASSALALGDRVEVVSGERLAADGEIVSGQAWLDESHLTGEARPRSVEPGQTVYAGSLISDGRLEVRLTQLGQSSLLAQVGRLLESSQGRPSPLQRSADRIARWILPLVVILSVLTGWVTQSWERALTVLIITCPCALGLATPLVVSLASGLGARVGVLFRDGSALEAAAQVNHLVLDKTGTLTEGELELVGSPSPQHLLWAASLESGCHHPQARALMRRTSDKLLAVDEWKLVAGQGVEGRIEGRSMRLGRADFVGCTEDSEGSACWLAVEGQVVERFDFRDQLRPEAPALLAYLKGRGIEVSLASGDQSRWVGQVAQQLGISHYRGGCLPQDKVEWVQQLQRQGKVVAFLGDGLNDAPAMRAAHLGLCVANGSPLSWEVAGLVLLQSGLAPAQKALDLAQKARLHLYVNFALAILYNAVAIPSAAMGWVTPLWAAVAMPLSSLAVVGQSLLLGKDYYGRSVFSDSSRPAALRGGPKPLHLGGAAGTV
jgi:Cu2+-exporting ATPase